MEEELHKEIKTVSIQTLGCRSNQYDSAAIEEIVTSGGLVTVPFPGPADAYIINTCTVTGKTDSQSRQTIRKAKRKNPEAVVIVTGCYAQVSKDEVAAIEGVDYVLGNPEKEKVLKYIRKGLAKETVIDVGENTTGTPITLRAASYPGRTRANLKIQDGCDRFCTYCIIPTARGNPRSLPTDMVLKDIKTLADTGCREIVFTGIHLGGWGTDLSPKLDIAKLLKIIEAENFPCRIRLSSIDPDEVTDELIETVAALDLVCKHIHMPLQSGDDAVLSRMKRPYDTAYFKERVLKIRAQLPNASVGTDIIAGFPGETEEEFQNTFDLLASLPVSYLHVFPYSVRKGTAAAKMDGQLDPRVISERVKKLRTLDKEKRENFYNDNLGRNETVLVETNADDPGEILKGRSGNYIPVFIERDDKKNEINGQVIVKLKKVTPDGMLGLLTTKNDAKA